VSRPIAIVALLLGACRGLLGIEEGVVGDAGANNDAGDASTTTDANLCADPGCACTTHDTCRSEVCLAAGACANTTDVAYIAPFGSNASCTQMLPCGTLGAANATNRSIIKATGAISDNGMVTITGTVAIYGAPSATIGNVGVGSVVQVANSANVSIYDLGIHGANSGTGMHGIVMGSGSGGPMLRVIRSRIYGNAGAGIQTSGGTLVVDRSVIAENATIGIYIDFSTFTITNSIIVKNGNNMANPGGADLDPAPGSRFELNTVADNISMLANGRRVGINCVAALNLDNLLTANGVATGSCTHRYSLVDVVPPGGNNNFTGSPMFVQTETMDFPGYYHIQSGSAARDHGTASTITVDIDGDPRPANAIDVGADEFVP
jgi:hypothetical protein